MPEKRASEGVCVIMAGGRGTRFWPLSRARRPKQLLALNSETSLLRQTYERVLPLVGVEGILIITNQDMIDAVTHELPEIPSSHIIGEPTGRNTAPCAALGMGLAERLFGQVPVALLPADHWIPDLQKFRTQLVAAFARATDSGLAVTFGIPPTRPETGYGYLEIGEKLPADDTAIVTSQMEHQPELATPAGKAASSGGDEFWSGLRFVEKPDLATAEEYLNSGRYLWNSGIFVWNTHAFQSALKTYLPEVATCLAPAVEAHGTDMFQSTLDSAYADCPQVSLDYGIMEKLPTFIVGRADFPWSDIGSWDVWGGMAEELEGGNRGRAVLYNLESQGNVVFAPGKTVALVGVNDLIIVDTEDALLICQGEDAQRIREITQRLAKENRLDLL